MKLTPIIPDDPNAEWMSRGLCSKERPIGEGDNWFPDTDDWRNGLTLEVIAVCIECPVREECLAYAMEFEGSLVETGRYGIWGGLTPGQRARAAQGIDEKPHERTRCRRGGHELTPENTMHRTRKRNGKVENYRACRECDRAYARKRYAKQREEREAS